MKKISPQKIKDIKKYHFGSGTSSLSTITVSAGSDVLSTSAELVDSKTVKVNILEEMAYGKEYTINFAAITDDEGRPIETEKKTISFSTEEVPALYVTGTRAFADVGAYALETDELIADGYIYTVESAVENTVSEAKEANVVYAIYDANGRLKDTAVVSKSVAAGKIEKIGTGLAIPAEYAGGTVRIMLWDSITFMQPYVKPLVFNIAQ